MSAREIVISKLVTVTAVTDLVGTRIWPSRAEQGAQMPYLLVHKPGQVNPQLLEGDAGYPQSRISIECVAASAAGADALGGAVFDALKNVTNETVTTGASPSPHDVTIIPADSDVDDYSDERQAFRRVIDFHCWWRQ